LWLFYLFSQGFLTDKLPSNSIRLWHDPAVHVAILTAGKRIVELCDQANYLDYTEAVSREMAQAMMRIFRWIS
jgi:hypothetical protein